MLEQLRRQGASIFIYFIFGLLIVIFVINFAPSGHGESGCSTQGNQVVAVDGVDANQTAYLVAYSSSNQSGRNRVYLALEQVIRRELLAQAAAERGIVTTGEMVDEEIKRGSFFVGGQRIDFKRQFYEEGSGEPYFSFKRLAGWAQYLNVSVGSYRDEQARGLQAAMMADLLTDSVRVSREE